MIALKLPSKIVLVLICRIMLYNCSLRNKFENSRHFQRRNAQSSSTHTKTASSADFNITGIYLLHKNGKILGVQGRVYHIPVYSTLPRSNIPYSGIFDLTKAEYTMFQSTRPYQGWIYHIPVYSTSLRLNMPYSSLFDLRKKF